MHSPISQPENLQQHTTGRIGTLSTRLAQSPDEIYAAQRLRYRVFREDHKDHIANVDEQNPVDTDKYDPHFDHLIVLDSGTRSTETIVGTQRFMVRDASNGADNFYSSTEFDLRSVLAKHQDKRFMELGRSCILQEYRNKRTIELLWHGTWDYALRNRADVMLGCASIKAVDPEAISEELGFLSTLTASDEWAVSSLHPNRIDMKEYSDQVKNPRQALRKLPPLLKGYLRLGAKFSDIAVPDPDFGTIDVLVILPVIDINPKYIAHYGANAERHRA